MVPASLAALRAALSADHGPAPFSPDARHAAVAIVLCRVPEPGLLLIRRAHRAGDPWSGHMAFPGGRVEATDRSLLHAAIRETEEELGLPLSPAKCIGRLPEQRGYAKGKRLSLLVHPFVFEQAEETSLRPNPEEVADTLLLPWHATTAPEHHDMLSWQPDAETDPIPLPCIRYGGAQIWGMTYRMLYELFQAARAPWPSSPAP